jgi:hypothetical protein
LHAFRLAHRKAKWWPAAFAGSIALLLAAPALSHAEESNPNNYSCQGHIGAGQPELGSEEQQVRYTIACNGPITGYQLQSQIPITGVQSPPLLSNLQAQPLPDTFSCSGEIPGYAVNCVGATKLAFETVTGQFAIASKLCAEPRVDPLLTVTYAYLEKGVVTQAISGPFDLGRPHGCPLLRGHGVQERLSSNQAPSEATSKRKTSNGKHHHNKARAHKHGKAASRR